MLTYPSHQSALHGFESHAGPMRINRKWKIGPVLPACVVFVFVGQRAIGLMLYITNESDKQSYTGIIY